MHFSVSVIQFYVYITEFLVKFFVFATGIAQSLTDIIDFLT